MGFAHGDDEVFTPEQLVQWFDLTAINPAPARFDQQKFEWIAGEHLKRVPTAQLARAVTPFLPVSAPDEGTLEAACDLYRDRVSTLKALAQSIAYFFTAPLVNTELLVLHLNETNRNAFRSVTQALAALTTWDKSQIGATIKSVQTQFALKPPQLMMPIRVAVSGGTSTPSVDATLAVLGQTKTLERLRAVV
jgi:glutamyl-tRNA synthetase